MNRRLLNFGMAFLAGAFSINAWAADTTTAKTAIKIVDADQPDTDLGVVAEDEAAQLGYLKIDNGKVVLGYSTWACNKIGFLKVDASDIDGTIKSASLKLQVSGSTDSKRTGGYCVGVSTVNWDDITTYATTDLSLTKLGGDFWTATKSSNGYEEAVFDISDALVGDEDKVANIVMLALNAAGGYVKDPVVTITYVSAGTELTSYKVMYVDEDANELREAIVHENIEIGENATASVSEMADFKNEDGTKKYTYLEGNMSIEIDANVDLNVISLVYREVEKVEYALYSSISETPIFSGEEFIGDDVYMFYPKYINVEGTLYEAPSDLSKNNSYYQYKLNIKPEENDVTVPYNETSINNVVFFVEGEEVLEPSTAGNMTVRCSNGLGGYVPSTPVKLCTLKPGSYKITCLTWGGEGLNYIAYWMEDDEQVVVMNHEVKGYLCGNTPEEFTLDETKDIMIYATEDNVARALDYIYIQKTTSEGGLEGEESTAIKTPSVENANGIYNLQGVKMNNLQKGLNIINGKKVLVK